MDEFFGDPWRTLTMDQVQAFLAEAGDEGLTWEAKGTQRPHPDSVLKHVSAFANTDGGFYIVGASREQKNTGPWHLDPIDFGDEPGAWFSRVIGNGLPPAPRFDVKEFPIDRRHVAIVNVDPVPEPPCVTRTGQVFSRVSGESPPVDDPATLRRLHDRGETRARGAQAEALRAAQRLFPAGPGQPNDAFLYVAYALAPLGRADDISGRLFTHAFFKEIDEAMDRLPASPLFLYHDRPGFRLTTQQDAFIVRDHNDNRHKWSLVAAWDGSVGIAHEVRPDPEDAARLQATAVFADVVRPAEEAATRLVRALGGYGRMHAVLRVFGRQLTLGSVQGHHGVVPADDEILPMRTWTAGDDGRLTGYQFDRMRRELVRACGVLVYEPVDESEADDA